MESRPSAPYGAILFFMHGVSLFCIDIQQIKSIINEISHIMSIFLVFCAFSIRISIPSIDSCIRLRAAAAAAADVEC